MLGNVSVTRVNRLASLAVLPLMVLAIAFFSRFADNNAVSDEPPPRSGLVVVANLRSESLSFIDLATGDTRTLQLPGPPHEMVEAAGRIYVTLGRGNELVEIEPRSGAILRVVPVDGEPHGIAVHGDTLVVTLDKANAAIILDRATLTELRRYPTGNTPHTVAVSPNAIVVTDSRDNALRQIEPDVVSTTSGAMPESVVIVWNWAVSADAQSDTVTIAEIPGLLRARAIRVGGAPVRVIPFDAKSVLVALQGDGKVAQVSVPDGKVQRRIGVADRPDGLCVSPDSAYFGVASNAEGTLQFVSSKDWRVAQTLNLQDGLGACLWLVR